MAELTGTETATVVDAPLSGGGDGGGGGVRGVVMVTLCAAQEDVIVLSGVVAVTAGVTPPQVALMYMNRGVFAGKLQP